jgi:hypothetical protein
MRKIIFDKGLEIGNDRMVYNPSNQNPNITEIKENTDTSESLKQLNNDDIGTNKMSNIDMRSRLHESEIGGVLAIDTWVSFGALPLRCMDFTQRKKRLNVSKDGLGRKEMVEMVVGKREAENVAKSGWDKFKSSLGFGNTQRGEQK